MKIFIELMGKYEIKEELRCKYGKYNINQIWINAHRQSL
jgi:hypothetical protein